MKKSPGILAFDIDGTLTDGVGGVPEEVAGRLGGLFREGWSVFFLTGRSATWAMLPLSGLLFPYFLAVQNGAAILQMPSREVVAHANLGGEILADLDAVLRIFPLFAVVEGGVLLEDRCYYRRSGDGGGEEEALLATRRRLVPVVWEEVREFSRDVALEYFPLIKLFGRRETVGKALEVLSSCGLVNTTCVKDPFSSYFIGMVTHVFADKGKALESLKSVVGQDKIVIAAGDDHNDLPMLEVADIRLVMETAPLEVRRVADFVVPPACKGGILDGLALALERLS